MYQKDLIKAILKTKKQFIVYNLSDDKSRSIKLPLQPLFNPSKTLTKALSTYP
jgi:hypothetical protein